MNNYDDITSRRTSMRAVSLKIDSDEMNEIDAYIREEQDALQSNKFDSPRTKEEDFTKNGKVDMDKITTMIDGSKSLHHRLAKKTNCKKNAATIQS